MTDLTLTIIIRNADAYRPISKVADNIDEIMTEEFRFEAVGSISIDMRMESSDGEILIERHMEGEE